MTGNRGSRVSGTERGSTVLTAYDGQRCSKMFKDIASTRFLGISGGPKQAQILYLKHKVSRNWWRSKTSIYSKMFEDVQGYSNMITYIQIYSKISKMFEYSQIYIVSNLGCV